MWHTCTLYSQQCHSEARLCWQIRDNRRVLRPNQTSRGSPGRLTLDSNLCPRSFQKGGITVVGSPLKPPPVFVHRYSRDTKPSDGSADGSADGSDCAGLTRASRLNFTYREASLARTHLQQALAMDREDKVMAGSVFFAKHFGLSERPFTLLPDPDFLYWSMRFWNTAS